MRPKLKLDQTWEERTAYQQGMRAYADGLSHQSNPYPRGFAIERHWNDGFKKAKMDARYDKS